ncbi:MAG: hypothetical protein ISR58_21575 [Anaerolineales bacterium]|nr:hypothetical protein [Chloroflexota bacterium]MBL6983782.1 hypothetical protein [Anaerolineales bacterium]
MRTEFERNPEIHALAETLWRTFIQRDDLYARQLDDGRYCCVRKALTEKHLLAHLKGGITLGAYVLDTDSRARFAVIDADDDHQLARLADMRLSLAREGVPSYLEASRRGGHLWFFFDEPISGKTARSFGKSILKSVDLNDIELFPKQDKLGDGPGSLIRLPFGVHRKDGQRYGFVTIRGEALASTYAGQIRVMASPRVVDKAAIEKVINWNQVPKREPVLVKVDVNGEALSVQIKRSMRVLDFVGEYVELAPNGRGLCPFHDDHNASFSVNTEKNYWHCFSGCGGGSLIDFWIKLKDVDFKDAVGELAKMLLIE